MESFSRQSGSKAEISVAKLTKAEKCTSGALLKWLLFDYCIAEKFRQEFNFVAFVRAIF